MRLLGPMFWLELRANARRPRSFWLRTLYAGLLLVALCNVLAPELGRAGGRLPATSAARVAEPFFWAGSLVQLLTVLVLTPAVTAGTIAQEKERGTLEHLLTTDLGAAEILLGKLGARFVSMAVLLSAGLPVLGLAVWLGGVPIETLLAVLGLTAVMLLATGALSLWVSIHARRGREAVQVVYAVGLIVVLFPPVFARSPIPWPGGVVGATLRLVDQGLIRVNPLVWLLGSWQTGSPDWRDWAVVVAANGVLGLVLFVLAAWQLRRAALPQTPRISRWRHLPAFRLMRPRPGRRPMAWKEFFTDPPATGLERVVRAVVSAIGWGALLWMVWAFAVTVTTPAGNPRTPFRVFALLVGPSLVCIALLGVVVRAATCISSEREHKTWDALLLTPLGAGEIVWAKLLGCLFTVRRVWLLVALLWLLGGTSGQIGLGSVAGMLVLTVVLALCAATLGLLLSLRLRTSVQALAVALAISLFLSGGYLLLALPLLLPAGSGPPPWLLCPCVTFLLVGSMLLGVDNPPGAGQLLATCAGGGLLYGALWLVLLWIVRRRFDRWAGRSLVGGTYEPGVSSRQLGP